MSDLAKYKIDNEIIFSQHGMEELKKSPVRYCLFPWEAKPGKVAGCADNVCRIEDEVDDLEEELRNKHIERLSSGLCKPSNGVVFLDICLIGENDHATNLVDCVLREIKEKKIS